MISDSSANGEESDQLAEEGSIPLQRSAVREHMQRLGYSAAEYEAFENEYQMMGILEVDGDYIRLETR